MIKKTCKWLFFCFFLFFIFYFLFFKLLNIYAANGWSSSSLSKGNGIGEGGV